jgi:acetate kinase
LCLCIRESERSLPYTVKLLTIRKSGLAALAGTTNFGLILTRLSDPSSCSSQEHQKAKLAYAVYLDRLIGYLSQYVFKLLSSGVDQKAFDGIVFSGGIGEKGAQLRKDVLDRFKWMGCVVDDKVNEEGESKEQVREITAEGSEVKGWVVETDEEGWCARLAREHFDF